MDTTPLQSALASLGTALSVGLGFLVAVALITLLTAQVLRDAYHSPTLVIYPRRTKLITTVLLVAFGVGMLLRILQMQGLTGP
jgi:uncharacterized membrane protein YraQ (UPF0718 family)